ncbi:TetR/AcrR family transcriptional regulator [Amycolatopsis cihanbeyliensis]|uniref:TetR family transcriptional regulator n=1 Tax=Amycolatopsis cihanbeyliensis TaxID=1128664 RepID=UPI001B8700C0
MPAVPVAFRCRRAAECSEAALYKHFVSKEELFVVVLQERLPPPSARCWPS